MAPLALALQLALASPGLVPSLEDPGPFRAGELAAASVGVFAGDLAVLGAGYLTLQLFAHGAFDPNAENFRRAAYGLAAAALVVPPLAAVLLARWARSEPARGAAWKAMLLASVGHLAAVAVGIAASPHYWAIIPVQLVAVGLGTSLGLHWGPRPRSVRAPDADADAGAGEDAAAAPPARGTGDEAAPSPAARLGWPGQCAVG